MEFARTVAAKGAGEILLTSMDRDGTRSGFNLPGATLDELRHIAQPCLLMYADHSRCLATGEALHRLWPHSRYELIEDAGHFFPMTHAGHVTQSLMNWAANVDSMRVPQ